MTIAYCSTIFIMRKDFKQTVRGKKPINGHFKKGDKIYVYDTLPDNCQCFEVRHSTGNSFVSFSDYGKAENFIKLYCE